MDNSFLETLVVPLLEDVRKLEWRRDFDRVARRIDSRLKRDIPQALRKRLMIEQEILKRVPEQYPHAWSKTLNMLRNNIRDSKDSKPEILWEGDVVDWIYVGEEARLWSSFLKNVLETRKEYENRALDQGSVRSKMESFGLLNKTTVSTKKQGGAGCRLCTRRAPGVQEEAEREGEDIKVYLPLPTEYAQIENAKIRSVRIREEEAEKQEYVITRADTSQCTICFHIEHKEGQKYSVEFFPESRETYLDFSHVSSEHSGKKHSREKQGTNGSTGSADVWLTQQQLHIRFAPLIWESVVEVMGE